MFSLSSSTKIGLNHSWSWIWIPYQTQFHWNSKIFGEFPLFLHPNKGRFPQKEQYATDEWEWELSSCLISSLTPSLCCYQHNTSYYSKYKIYSWEIINISGPSVNKSSPSRQRYWPIHGHQNTVTQSVELRIRDELSDTRWFWRGSGRAWCIRLHHLIKITTCKLGKYIYVYIHC